MKEQPRGEKSKKTLLSFGETRETMNVFELKRLVDLLRRKALKEREINGTIFPSYVEEYLKKRLGEKMYDEFHALLSHIYVALFNGKEKSKEDALKNTVESLNLEGGKVTKAIELYYSLGRIGRWYWIVENYGVEISRIVRELVKKYKDREMRILAGKVIDYVLSRIDILEKGYTILKEVRKLELPRTPVRKREIKIDISIELPPVPEPPKDSVDFTSDYLNLFV